MTTRMIENKARHQLNRRRVTAGAVIFGGRQLLTTIMGVFTAALLARWLQPDDYGLFAQMSFWIISTTAMLIGDLGLILAIVRLPDEPTEEQWMATSTLMNILSIVTATVVACIGWVMTVHGRGHMLPLMLLLGAVTALRFLRTVPSARLQRQHRFAAIAGSEFVESIVYYICAITAAKANAGVFALALGVASKEIMGLVLLYALVRGYPTFSLHSLPAVVGLIRVGLPQQGTGLLVGLTDAFQPIFIGGILGIVALGYVSWAYAVILMPLALLTSASRVLVPVLALVQDDLLRLRAWTEQAAHIGVIFALPIAAFIIIRAEPLITQIFHEKWLPSSFLLRAFMPAVVCTALANPVLQAYNACGKTVVPFRLAACWLITTWTLGAWMTLKWQIEGFGWFYIIIQLTYVPVLLFAQRVLGVHVIRAAAPPALASLLAAVLLSLVTIPQSITALLLQGCLFLVIYAMLLAVLDRRAMLNDVRLIVNIC